MTIDKFNSILQDSLNSLDKYLKLLVERSYRLSKIEKIKEYSISIKNNISDQYNSLGKDLQQKFKNTFNEFSSKCDKMMESAIESLKSNYNIVARCNDTFYNERIPVISPTEQN